MKRLTAMILTLILTLSLLLTAAPALADTYATAVVKGGWLRLRAGASYDAETVSAYFTGTQVTILGGSGEWYYVSTPDGKIGYMNAGFLTITGSITGGQMAENTTAYVTSRNGLSVRLRTGPSTQYSTIASYAVGTQVTVLISGETWCKIRVGGRTGYMMTEFLTTTAPGAATTPTTGYTAYVTSKNGLGVRMRSGASKLYSTLATYSVGTQVTVLEYGRTWCKIRVGSLTGYMMTEFLTTTAPRLVSSVTLSDDSVWPGETLYATVYPSGVLVSYEWLNDKGVRLGSGSSYTVQTSDTGRKLRVRVTGKNGATGTAVSDWAVVQGEGYVSMNYLLTSVTISDNTPTVGQTLTATIKPSGATANISWFRDDGVFVTSGSTYTVHSTDVGHRLYVWAEGTGATTGSATSSYTQAVTGGNSGSSGNSGNSGSSGSTGGSGSASTTLRVDSVTLNDLTPTVGQTLYATVAPGTATALITWLRDDDKVLGYGTSYKVTADDEGHSLYVWAEGTGATFGSATSRITEEVTGSGATLIVPSTGTDVAW